MESLNKKVSRRKFLSLAGLAAAAGVLAACAPQASPTSAPAEQPTTAPAQGEATSAPAAADVTETPAPVSNSGAPVKLELWTFVNTHARWFRAMGEAYKAQKNPNFEINVTEIAYSDMHDKLKVALQAGGVGAPDLADIEQGAFGGFLRGGDPGLVDLSEWLNGGGYMDQLVAAREALYSYKGKVYGIEHALCPVVLYYRADIWEGAGADPTKFETWDDFITAASTIAKGDVKALAFPEHELLLRQRGSDYFDKDGNVTLDSQDSIDTMQWILDLRDQYKIADQAPSTDAAWYGAVNDGKYVSKPGADWYAGFFKDNVPDLKGKWKAALLPAVTKGGLRTSCLGGTGNCIIKTGKNVEECWKFQQFSMLSVEGNVQRFLLTNLFPPFKPAMDDKRLHTPDEYYSGQDLGALFAKCAPDVPPEYQSPYRAEMNTQLSTAMQDIYDGKQKPADALKKIADNIRKVMQEEA